LPARVAPSGDRQLPATAVICVRDWQRDDRLAAVDAFGRALMGPQPSRSGIVVSEAIQRNPGEIALSC